MDFHELLEIPQGDRRRYHDDISVIVISLEGRIWRSSMWVLLVFLEFESFEELTIITRIFFFFSHIIFSYDVFIHTLNSSLKYTPKWEYAYLLLFFVILVAPCIILFTLYHILVQTIFYIVIDNLLSRATRLGNYTNRWLNPQSIYKDYSVCTFVEIISFLVR